MDYVDHMLGALSGRAWSTRLKKNILNDDTAMENGVQDGN